MGGKAFELAGLAFRQEAGLVSEAEEVVVGVETFLGGGDAIIDGVDKVEGGMARDKLEGFGLWRDVDSGFLGHEDITSEIDFTGFGESCKLVTSHEHCNGYNICCQAPI